MDGSVAAGEYTGAVLFNMQGIIVKIPVQIHIYDVQLPEQVPSWSIIRIARDLSAKS